MEPITKADLKDLFAELRCVVKRSIAESIAEGFATWKPAVEAQVSGLQVDRDKGNSAADPFGPLPLKASITPPTTTGGVIPVLAAAAASDSFHDEAASATPTPTTERSLAVNFVVPSDRATPTIVERGPEIVLPASSGFITTAPETCSMEGLGCDTTESRPALASTTAPTVHTATVDINPVLAAPTASDGTIDDQAISGVAWTPTTSSTLCLPRHPMAAPLLGASSPPTSNKYALDTDSIRVATVPPAAMGDSPAVLAPTAFAPMIQMQQHHKDSEFFEPTSSQWIASKVHVHRPMPWPSFLDVHANGDETRPLPWPSFRICAAVVVPILDAYGMVRSLELELLPNGSTSITLLTVSLDSGNCAALSWEYFGVDNVDCVVSWLFDGVEERPLPWPSFSVICDPLSSELEETVAMNTMRRSVISDDQFSCAIQDASHWPRYIVTGIQMNLVLTAASRVAHWLVSHVCDGSTVSSLTAVLWDEWVLQLWDSRQQADFSCDQFTCAHHYTTCFPGNFVTGGQIQDFVACSTLHLFLSGFWVSFRSVVMLDLQIVSCCSRCVYLQKQQIVKVGIEGACLNIISSSVDHCRLDRSESVIAHSVDMEVYCSGFSRTSGGTVGESSLTPTIFSCARANLICFSSSKVCALLVVFLRNGARMKSELSKDVSFHATNVVIAVSHSSMMRSRFILMCWPEDQLLATWPLPIASCSVQNNMFSCLHGLQSLLYASELDRANLTGASEQEALNSDLQFRWCMPLYLVQGLIFLVYPTVTCTHVLSLRHILTDGHLHNQITLTCPAAVCIAELEGTIGDNFVISLKRQVKEEKSATWLLVVLSRFDTSKCIITSFADNVKYSHAIVVMLNSHGEPHPNDYHWQGGTRAELPRLVSCKSWLQNHEDTTQMQMQTGYSLQMDVTYSVQPILLLTQAAKLLMFIVTIDGEQGIFQGGRRMPATDRNKELRLPWDPGGAAAAWGQADFQGARGVSDLPVHHHGPAFGPLSGSAHLSATMGNTTKTRDTATGRASSWITAKARHGGSSSHLALFFYLFLLLLFSTLCLYLDELET